MDQEITNSNEVTINGTIEKIVFQNDDNGYTVCKVITDQMDEITAVGIMPYLCAGEMVTLYGKIVVNTKYGEQLSVESYEKTLPSTENAILTYLSSGSIKGIGHLIASRIVEKYGLDTFDVIENNPLWLCEIKGMTRKKALDISQQFKNQNGIRSVVSFCRDFFSPNISMQIYSKWGTDSLDVIKQNPYILCEKIGGIPFEKSEEIARSIGIKKKDPNRICAGIMYVLSYNREQNGHVYIPYSKLLAATSALLECEEELIATNLETLSQQEKVVITDVNDEKAVYEKNMYDDEKYVVEKLDLISKYGIRVADKDCEPLIKMVQASNAIQYSPEQDRAITEALENGVFILTGGPGTGKTTITKAMISILESFGAVVALCAPTGRAAKRMEEATGFETKTIHRLLEAQRDDLKGETLFLRNIDNPIEEDVVIVDESSMIDLPLLAALLRAVKKTVKIIFIGDANQLPPVGPGYVFRDIVKSDRYNTIELTNIFRQSRESMIVVNAHSINKGEHLDIKPVQGNDFFIVSRMDDESTMSAIVSLCEKGLKEKYKKTIYDGIQVISPSRKGACGTEALCARLQDRLNPPSQDKREKRFLNTVFRVGDKVMQNKNNYSLAWKKEGEADGEGVFNGDIGIIKSISLKDELVTVDYDGRVAQYDFNMLDEIELAYAITVHKSQGSEYPIIVIPLYKTSPKLLTRNLLYTAVTRAKSIVVLVGNPEIINGMIDNNKQTKRYTGLQYLLEHYD